MRPWAELSSAERMDAVLLAIDEIERGEASASTVAAFVAHHHPMKRPRPGKGAGNWERQMSQATRVTPAITALRNRGLIAMTRRRDGLSGTADVLTDAGRARLRAVER